MGSLPYRALRAESQPRPYEGIGVSSAYDWMQHAKCVVERIDPRIFDGFQQHAYGPTDYSQAKAICASCPVRRECLANAVENDEIACVRGGLEPDEYKLLKPDPRRSQYARVKRPGERGYGQGRRKHLVAV